MTQPLKSQGFMRSLGLVDVVSFGISATLGSGILVSVGYMTKYHTGPSAGACGQRQ